METLSPEIKLTTRTPRDVPVGSNDSILGIIARAASDPAVNVDKMERLYAMLKEENSRVAEQQFNEAMRQAQMEMPKIVKDARNPSTNSRYVQLETLSKVAVPIYTKHGFSLIFSEGESPNAAKIRVLCNVKHDGGHSCEFHLDLSPDDMGAKGNPSKTKIHGEGSTFSYGQRYLTKLIFNLTIVGEDDDGNQGSRPKPQGPATATPTTRAWMIAQLHDVERELQAYAIDQGWIMPDEPLAAFPLEHVPCTKSDLAALRAKITKP